MFSVFVYVRLACFVLTHKKKRQEDKIQYKTTYFRRSIRAKAKAHIWSRDGRSS